MILIIDSSYSNNLSKAIDCYFGPYYNEESKHYLKTLKYDYWMTLERFIDKEYNLIGDKIHSLILVGGSSSQCDLISKNLDKNVIIYKFDKYYPTKNQFIRGILTDQILLQHDNCR